MEKLESVGHYAHLKNVSTNSNTGLLLVLVFCPLVFRQSLKLRLRTTYFLSSPFTRWPLDATRSYLVVSQTRWHHHNSGASVATQVVLSGYRASLGCSGTTTTLEFRDDLRPRRWPPKATRLAVRRQHSWLLPCFEALVHAFRPTTGKARGSSGVKLYS